MLFVTVFIFLLFLQCPPKRQAYYCIDSNVGQILNPCVPSYSEVYVEYCSNDEERYWYPLMSLHFLLSLFFQM